MEDERRDQETELKSPPESLASETGEEPAPPQPRMNKLAVASLVSAFTCIGAPVALVLGIISLVRIGKEPEVYRGRDLAIAGTVLGGIGTLLLPLLVIPAAIMFPVFSRAREAAQKTACLSNVKQLSVATLMYTNDWEGHYPPTDGWTDALTGYIKNPNILVCPSAEDEGPSYAMNGRLESGIGEADVISAAETVMMFESVPGRNQFGGPELAPYPPRHMQSHSVGFADGHAESVEAGEIENLNWDPLTIPAPTPSEPVAPIVTPG